MSKITNNGLTRSGTGCFIAVSVFQHYPMASGRHRVKIYEMKFMTDKPWFMFNNNRGDFCMFGVSRLVRWRNEISNERSDPPLTTGKAFGYKNVLRQSSKCLLNRWIIQ